MNFENILYSVDDGVATLTLDRPEVSNGFNIPICEEILEAISLASKDSSVHILLINANGKVFSVGGDLVEMQRAVDDDNVQSLVRIAELVNDISFSLKRLPKPVVMSTDGAVAGAAANMAVAADFCIASDKTKFIQAFVNVGLAPDAGGLFLLTRAIGITRATQLAMTGEALTAEKALDYGIVYRVCESEKLEKMTERIITRLKRGSVNSYKAIKEMVWQSSFYGWQEYADLELELQKSLAFTEDFKEGVRAYTDKRRPKFTGK
ncbi:enoyl-CoA hydratase [Streptococcus macacae]|uniref:Enoyl-CoA hydratase/isomerase family protein n=1 Tax=Streptococcus macacae NCTC 11558 TaxID=764298 RepID=G5JY46_9STRE|nr:enoyl-CoA hydratase [Streptococcus macacae]EHJ52265.1 enoyl-CoA hydratase/isomerase family protein [Streptococcus macacae NCTC 11558]SUN77961.1 enoyl-CoA hydratase [Streptococcus macacae NCTC 11558]